MADLTTLGVTFHYGVETVKGTKPTAFTWLKRCSSIGGISLDTEQIDVSALEDFITQYASGRQDTGGTWDVTFFYHGSQLLFHCCNNNICFIFIGSTK